MTEKPLDFGKLTKYDEYVPVDMPIMGTKEVIRKTDGKKMRILICKTPDGREASLFDWALCERDGAPFVLRRALKTALDTAK